VAYRDAQRVRGEGDAKAANIYAQAFSQNPESSRSTAAWKPTARPSRRNDLMRSSRTPTLPLPQGRFGAVQQKMSDGHHLSPGARAELILEGVLPFIAPNLWRETFRRITQMTDARSASSG